MTVPGAIDGAAEESTALRDLHVFERSGRLDWTADASTVLERALGRRLSVDEWAMVPWYGPIDGLLDDGRVTDIALNWPGSDIRVMRGGSWESAGIVPHASWITFVQRQLLLRSKLVSPEAADAWPEAMLAGTAEGRFRFAVTQPPLTPLGPSFTVRVQPKQWRSLDELIRDDVVTRDAAEVLLEAVRSGASVLIAGSASAGKTTLTAALLLTLGDERRCILIEEARELPPLPNCVPMEVLRSGATFTECVRFSLRQKPELIVIGEVRGPEALAMLKAAATGHPGIGTIHAPDVAVALRNLERMACEAGEVSPALVRGYITSPAVSLLVVHIGRYGGQRRVGVVAEVVMQSGAGHSGDLVPLNPLFGYNHATRRLEQLHHVVGAWGLGRY